MFMCPKAFFLLIFISVSLNFAGNLSKDECGDFEWRNAEETTYGAYEGPSCLWRSVGGSVVQLLKEDGEVWPSVGLRSLWRSVLQVRREVQRSDPSTQIPRVEVFWNETLDGPLCLWRSVTLAVEGNEESSRRIAPSMGRRSPRRSVMTTTVHREVRRPSRVLADFQQLESLFN